MRHPLEENTRRLQTNQKENYDPDDLDQKHDEFDYNVSTQP